MAIRPKSTSSKKPASEAEAARMEADQAPAFEEGEENEIVQSGAIAGAESNQERNVNLGNLVNPVEQGDSGQIAYDGIEGGDIPEGLMKVELLRGYCPKYVPADKVRVDGYPSKAGPTSIILLKEKEARRLERRGGCKLAFPSSPLRWLSNQEVQAFKEEQLKAEMEKRAARIYAAKLAQIQSGNSDPDENWDS